MPTIKQQIAAKNLVENGGNIGKAMRDAGYSAATAKTPRKLTGSPGWAELMNKYLPDKALGEKHRELLNAVHIEHMVFPLEMKDEEIINLLKSVNCTAKKFQRGDMATHVWFWARDNIEYNGGPCRRYPCNLFSSLRAGFFLLR